ncbi:MAG: hypothetical protein HXX17_07020 [Geobacteraceae bacterium]|nr:hypothetical protein [Geobacteraceae bacterium]
MLNFRLLLQSLAILIMSGCAQSVNYGQLKLDPGTSGAENVFNSSTNAKKYNVFFYYSPETGSVEIKDIVVGTVIESYVEKALTGNKELLEKEKKVLDCLTVEYRNPNTPKYSPCLFKNDEKSLSVFTKNDVDVASGIAGTIVSPLALAVTLLGSPMNPYTNTLKVVRDQDAIQAFGKAVNSKVGIETQLSCKVTDSSIAGWYRGECVAGKAHGSGIAVGKDKYAGKFVEGVSQGKGWYQWNNGDIYDGEFAHNDLHGKGTFKWNSGAVYVGEFVQGNRTGNGEYTYKDGRTEKGFYLDGKLLSESEYSEYRCKTDPVFEKEYRHKQYVDAFNSAKSSKDFEGFIAKYAANDPDNLVIQAKNRRVLALREEIKETLNRAKNSYEYEEFIQSNAKYDPDKLIPKAKSLKADALRREKAEYDKVMSAGWSGNYKVRITFDTSPGKAIKLLDDVKAAVHVRDPWGVFNPYWVPSFHAAAAYNDKGVIIGEWYTGYYDGWNDWGKYLEPILAKLGVGYKVTPLGNTVRPASNYSPQSTSSGSSTPSASNSNSRSSSSSSSQKPAATVGYKITKNIDEKTSIKQRIAEIECNNGHKGYVWLDPRASVNSTDRYTAGGEFSGSLEPSYGTDFNSVAIQACRNR